VSGFKIITLPLHNQRQEEEYGLAELDGVLPSPGKKGRK